MFFFDFFDFSDLIYLILFKNTISNEWQQFPKALYGIRKLTKPRFGIVDSAGTQVR